jgi:acetate kinase
MAIMGDKIVLSVNAGSSSIKTAAYQVSPDKPPRKLAAVELDNIGDASKVTLKYETKHPKENKDDADSGESTVSDFKSNALGDAFPLILTHLTGEHGPAEIRSKTDINYIAHRIVHGGETESPRVLDEELLEYVEELSDLAPLYVA